MSGRVGTRLAGLDITLPSVAGPVANYVPHQMAGNLLYISGQLSITADGEAIAGHLGTGLSLEDGQKAARAAALNLLAQAQAAIGDLDRIEQIVRLNGYVAASPEFTDHPKVINGASDLMIDVFGEQGHHTRAAVGVASLPLGCAVEIDAIFKVLAS